MFSLSGKKATIFCILLISTTIFADEYEERIGFLRNHVIPIDSADVRDDDFSDLMGLKEKIGDARIVMIGEETHGCGKSMEIKSRLIRFLHTEMGFNVLAWESNIHQCNMMNDYLQDDSIDVTTAARKGIFPIWAGTENVRPLFKYIRETMYTDNPLIQCGFDIRVSGKISERLRINDIKAYLLNVAGSESIFRTLEILYANSAVINSYEGSEELVHENLQRCHEIILFLENNKKALCEADDELKYHYYHRVLTSQYHMMKLNEISNRDEYVTNHRDKYMAHNLRFLVESYFPEEKFIVWAASAHVARNADTDTNYSPTTKWMGDYIDDFFGKQAYIIGTLSYMGESYWIGGIYPRTYLKAQESSFEWYLNELGYDFGFLDMRNHEGTPFIHTELTGRFFGPKYFSGEWHKVFDGIVFIKEQTGVEGHVVN